MSKEDFIREYDRSEEASRMADAKGKEPDMVTIEVDGDTYEVTLKAEAHGVQTVRAASADYPRGAEIGKLYLDRNGDCKAATTTVTGALATFRPGSIRDLIRAWVAATEVRQCWACGKMASAEHGDRFEGWTTQTVDTDPGNAEVGPDPCIIDVDVCRECSAHDDDAPCDCPRCSGHPEDEAAEEDRAAIREERRQIRAWRNDSGV